MMENRNQMVEARMDVAVLGRFETTHLKAADLPRDRHLSHKGTLRRTLRLVQRMLASQAQTFGGDEGADITLTVDSIDRRGMLCGFVTGPMFCFWGENSYLKLPFSMFLLGEEST